MGYNIIYSCVSHIGNIRTMNQDNFICNGKSLEDGHRETIAPIHGIQSSKSSPLFAVFDGMGGEECGEIAAGIAAETASHFELCEDGISELRDYCTEANAAICKYAEDHGIIAMGTTAAMLLFAPKSILLCNIGDSKVFHISTVGLKQISKDHVAFSVFGKKPPLSQNLGISPAEMIIDPYISKGRYTSGDKYLICSDGLTDMLSINEISEIIDQHPVSEAANALLSRALENGGKDNITLILLEIKKTSLFSSFKKKVEGTKL